jgi:hypothetical protein
LPSISLPAVRVPSVSLPSVLVTSRVSVPSLSLPSLGVPPVSVPAVTTLSSASVVPPASAPELGGSSPTLPALTAWPAPVAGVPSPSLSSPPGSQQPVTSTPAPQPSQPLVPGSGSSVTPCPASLPLAPAHVMRGSSTGVPVLTAPDFGPLPVAPNVPLGPGNGIHRTSTIGEHSDRSATHSLGRGAPGPVVPVPTGLQLAQTSTAPHHLDAPISAPTHPISSQSATKSWSGPRPLSTISAPVVHDGQGVMVPDRGLPNSPAGELGTPTTSLNDGFGAHTGNEPSSILTARSNDGTRPVPALPSAPGVPSAPPTSPAGSVPCSSASGSSGTGVPFALGSSRLVFGLWPSSRVRLLPDSSNPAFLLTLLERPG